MVLRFSSSYTSPKMTTSRYNQSYHLMPGMDSIILSGMLSYKHLLILRFEHLSVCVNWVLQLATMLQCSHLQRDPLKNWLRLVDVFSLTQVSLDLLQGNQIMENQKGQFTGVAVSRLVWLPRPLFEIHLAKIAHTIWIQRPQCSVNLKFLKAKTGIYENGLWRVSPSCRWTQAWRRSCVRMSRLSGLWLSWPSLDAR